MKKLYKLMIIGLLLPLSICSLGLAVERDEAIQLDVQEFMLDNGMLFLIVERHTAPQVACRLAIRAGSALEDVGRTGIAHLLEHMMFKGTKNFGTLDVERDQDLQERIEAAYQVILAEKRKRQPYIDLIEKKKNEMERLRLEVQKIYVPQALSSQVERNGATGVNAFTTKDQTQYIMSIPSDMIEQWFSIMSEQIFEPAWREFYVEKEVVQREWAYRYINNPNGAAWLDLYATAFTAHPYENPTIGWRSDMDDYNTTDAMEFHWKYYSPTNAVCVLVGDVTVEQVKRFAEIYFARYPVGNRTPEVVTREPAQEGSRMRIRYLKGARTPLILLGFHGAPMGEKDFYALDAMTMILSHGRSSRMNQNIIQRGLAVQAWAYNPDNRYGDLVILGGSPNEPKLEKENMNEEEKRRIYVKACEELDQLLMGEAEKMKTEDVSDHELRRIKKMMYREFLDRMKNNEELASTLATLEVQQGWQYLTTYLDEIEMITKEDIKRVARKHIHDENKNVVYLIPGGEPDQPPETYTEIRSASGATKSRAIKPEDWINHSVYPTPPEWRHPLSFERRPEKIVYPGAETTKVKGAPVFYLADPELPLIDLTLLIRAGAVDIAEDKTGMAQLLGEALIRGGTKNHSPAELAMMLDEDAIRLSISINEEDASIHLSVMKEDWEKGLTILNDLLVHPKFDETVLNILKEQAIIALQRQGEDAQAVAGREWEILHFKGHPYGRDPLKALDTIPELTQDDLAGFLGRYFAPPNMVVTVAGDIEMGRLITDLDQILFQGFSEQEAVETSLPEPKPTAPILALIHKPGQVQSQIIMGKNGIKRNHPDYWKLNLLTQILGGSDSLMYKRLRDDLGLVYASWFGQTYKWEAGILMGYIGCRADKTRQAITETVKIMGQLQSHVPQEDLDQKRLDSLNSFIFNVDTPQELVEVYGRYHMRQEPLDTLERIQDAYLASNRKEMEALAKRYLNPRQLQIVVVADKTVRVQKENGQEITLEADLQGLAKELRLPYQEIALR
ncbi:MAG: insulinase family protein [Deltaproteobacteria bacterium]|nr:insulinase family protein [Deltaproteobacteria bacterium]